jgi:uncharacterized protein
MPNPVIDHALDRDLTEVGMSRIAGRGLFAKRQIHKGARIIEYKGRRREVIDVVSEPPLHDAAADYIFHLHDGWVIDGAIEGSDARYINHSCAPNCDPLAFGGKVFIYAAREIAAGEELTFDYNLRPALSLEGNAIPAAKNECKCGAVDCRGTMLAADLMPFPSRNKYPL